MLETYSSRAIGSCCWIAQGAAIEQPEIQTSINEWLGGKFSPGHAVCAYEIIPAPGRVYSWSAEPR